jgi:biotin carboxyl carrier protein
MANLNQPSFISKVSTGTKNFFSKIVSTSRKGTQKTSAFISRRPFVSFITTLVILLALIILGSTVFKAKPVEQPKQATVKSVQTFKIGSSPKVSTQAQVEKTGVIKVVAQMPGIVSYISVTEGNVVGKGQNLIGLSSNYQGGNALSVARQISQTQNNLSNQTYDTQKDLIAKQREVAERTDANADQLRDIANRSLDESRSLLDLNESLLSSLDSQISQSTGSAQESLKGQKAQFLGAINQLKQGIRQSEYQSASDRPPAQLSDLGREITLKNLEIQEKSLEANKQISNLSLLASQITEAQMYPAAPFAATIERVHVRVGEAVNPGTVLVTLNQTTDDIILNAKVPAATAKNLSKFEKSTIHIGDKTLDLAPYYISSEATDGQMYSVLFVLGDEYKELFTDKSFVQVDIPVGAPDTNSVVPFIPLDAIFQTQDESVIYIVKDGKAQAKKVQLGDVQGRFVAVTEGIGENDEVILSRTVVEGDQVQVNQ